MTGKKLLPLICIGLALLLMLAVLFLQLHNRIEDQTAGAAAQEVVAALEALVTEPSQLPEETADTPAQPEEQPALSSYVLDGHEYVGYLIFPSLERKLPLMKIVYLEDLEIAPCLEKGSPLTDDAVISAHNYYSHFGPIRDWTGGEQVVFSTLEGEEIHYTVISVETIEGTDVDKVMNSPHDLVLYTCTTGGKQRIMLACDRTQ